MALVNLNWRQDADSDLCETTQPSAFPSRNELFEKYHINELSKVSEHPLCVSCFAWYLKDCAKLAPLMKLSLNQYKEFTIGELQTRIHEWIEVVKTLWQNGQNDQIIEWLTLVETALIKICTCLSRRMLHHQLCTLPANQQSKGSVHSDPNHDVFLVQLCYSLNQMYEMYQTLITCFNFFVANANISKRSDKVKPAFTTVFNNCVRKVSSLKNIDDTNILDKKYVKAQRQQYLQTKTKPMSRKTRTKQSRVKPKRAYSMYRQDRSQ
jgi:hypothetical protein